MSALSMHTEFTNSMMNPVKPTAPKMDVSVTQKQFVLFSQDISYVKLQGRGLQFEEKVLKFHFDWIHQPITLFKHDPSFSIKGKIY